MNKENMCKEHGRNIMLVINDFYSNYIEVTRLQSTTSWNVFALFSIPDLAYSTHLQNLECLRKRERLTTSHHPHIMHSRTWITM